MCVWGGGGGQVTIIVWVEGAEEMSLGQESPHCALCWYKHAVVCIGIMSLSQVRAGQWVVYFVPRGECVSGDLPLVLSTPQA